LRKTLIAALAAFVVVGAAGAVAVAQSPSAGAEITASISPSKVGTKKKPKPTKITLEVKNDDSSQTAKELKIYTPKQIKVNGKGLKYCKQSKLEENLDPSACPGKSKLGTGTADAIAGVNGGSPAPLKFNVTAFLLSKKKIGFLIKQQGGDIAALAIGTMKKGGSGYGGLLDVQIPQIAREYPTGSFNGLVGLKTSLYKKIGKKSLYKSTGCSSSRTLAFKTVIVFQPNPNPPKAETVTALGTADCKK
jgi:hypothetical protein